MGVLLRQRQRRPGPGGPVRPLRALRAEQPDPDPDHHPGHHPGEGAGDVPGTCQGTREGPAQAQKAPEKAPEKAPAKAATSTPRPKAAADEPAKGSSTPVAKDPKPAAPSPADDEPTYTVLRGAPARTAANMDASLSVPTATSVRSVPVKLLWDNRTVINNHLARARGGKVSFTHIIGYALVKALRSMPEMNVGFEVVDGKPNLITPAHINLGLAIDMQKPDGTRQLLVPNIKGAEAMDFAAFWTAYEEMVRKARDGKLTVADFQGTTMSLTNPGGIGTVHSVPRLGAGNTFRGALDVACATPCPKGTLASAFAGRVGLALTTEHPSQRAHPEEAKQPVPQSSGNQSPEQPSADFGANEWLVEEMYDQYQKDPGSVDPTWATYFKAQRPAQRRRQRRRRAAAPAGRAAGRPEAAAAEGPAEHRRRGPRRPTPRRAKAEPDEGRDARPGRQAPPRRQGRRAGQGHHQPGAQGVQARRARRGERPADVHRAARRARPHRREHGRLADRADRHLGALGAGQAALGQPHRHQQPPRPRPRRQGLLHPPDRLRAGQGAQGDAGDERRLRRRSTASRT